jgi:hypothetical protein
MEQDVEKNNIIKKITASPILVRVGLVVGIIAVGLLILQQAFDYTTKQGSNKLTGNKPKEMQAIQSEENIKKTKAADVTPDEGATLFFDKQDQERAVNESFSLIAMQDPAGKKINAVDLHIVFDPKLLKLESIEPAGEFSLLLTDSQIDNESGVASIIVAVPLEAKSIEVSSVVATLNFKSITAGRAVVSFTDKSVAAADEEANNVVAVRGTTTVNIK